MLPIRATHHIYAVTVNGFKIKFILTNKVNDKNNSKSTKQETKVWKLLPAEWRYPNPMSHY